MATPTYSYQQPYPQQQQQQQLVPHYGPSFDPYGVNQNQQYPQQQGPPAAFNPNYYYSPTSTPAPANDGVPTRVSTSPHHASDPSVLSSPSMGDIQVDDNDNDIPDEIIKSQELAWKNALAQNVAKQETAMTTYNIQSKVKVPRSQNPTGSDSVHPNKKEMKEGRKMTTAAAATSGALVGAIVTGPAFPIGALIGGAVSGYTANKLHKQGERRAQRKWEQSNFQLGTHQAPIFQNNKGTAATHSIV